MLRKKTSGVASGPLSSSFIGKAAEKVVDRRAFLRGSGLAIGGIAAASALVGTNVKPAQAVTAGGAAEIKKTVCTHCSVGCTVMAEVQNGVWTGQEPGWIARLTSVRIVRKARQCGKPPVVSVA